MIIIKNKPLEDYIGEKYGCLTIVGVDRGRREREKNRHTYVFADCDCGNKGKSYRLEQLINGQIKSCGHLKKMPRKKNNIVLKDDYGYLIADSGTRFYFDIEDKKYLENRHWYENSNGYLITCTREGNGERKYIFFHRLIMGAKEGEIIDHISRQKNDNRKSNLRFCNQRDNTINRSKLERNSTGIIGVGYDEKYQKWLARIGVNYELYNLGRFDTRLEAIICRLQAEKRYFGEEFAPQRHLFEKYGI